MELKEIDISARNWVDSAQDRDYMHFGSPSTYNVGANWMTPCLANKLQICGDPVTPGAT